MATSERSAREILQRRYDKQNQYNKETYDRLAVFVPKGTKEKIKEKIGKQSINSYVVGLILADLEEESEAAEE